MDPDKTFKIAMLLGGMAAALLLAFLIGKQVGLAEKSARPSNAAGGTGAVPPVIPGMDMTKETGTAESDKSVGLPEADGTNHMSVQLVAAQRSLEIAKKAMRQANAGTHGGFVERARVDVEQISADMIEAIAYADGHSALSELSAVTSPEAAIAAAHVHGMHFKSPRTQAYVSNGLKALQSTLQEVEDAGGGNIGGLRDKIILDIDHAAMDVEAAFNYLESRQGKQPAGDAPSPADGAP